jgi:hypothetical protein
MVGEEDSRWRAWLLENLNLIAGEDGCGKKF